MSKRAELIQKIKNIDQEIAKITDEKKFRIDQLKELMKSLQDDLKPKITQSKSLKEERQQRQNKLNTLQSKMEALVKDFYLKRKWTSDDLQERLEKIETDLQNRKVTSTEEKKFLVEIEKIKLTMESLEEYEVLYNEYTIIKNDLKGINVGDLSKELSEKFKLLKQYQEEYRSLKTQKKTDQGETTERVVSDQEKKFINQKETLKKQTNDFNTEHQRVFDKYLADLEHYQKVQFQEH